MHFSSLGRPPFVQAIVLPPSTTGLLQPLEVKARSLHAPIPTLKDHGRRFTLSHGVPLSHPLSRLLFLRKNVSFIPSFTVSLFLYLSFSLSFSFSHPWQPRRYLSLVSAPPPSSSSSLSLTFRVSPSARANPAPPTKSVLGDSRIRGYDSRGLRSRRLVGRERYVVGTGGT